MLKWKPHTLRNPLALLIGGVVIFVGVSLYLSHHRTYYIGNADHSLRFKVPEDIIAAKDCKRYQEFVHSLVRPMFVPDDDCPWPWDKVGPMAHFVVNGVKFDIPREYLFASRGTPDGEVDDISILLRYPEMTSVSIEDGDQSKNIHISILSNKGLCNINKDCAAASRYYFQDHLKPYSGREYGRNYNPKMPIRIKQLEDEVVLYDYDYNFKLGYSFEYYIKGTPLEPNYWLKCAPPLREDEAISRNPHCESVFNWNEKFIVMYRFDRKNLLVEQIRIYQKINKKLREFVVKTKE